MIRIRNAHQYHEAVARVEQLQNMKDRDVLGAWKHLNELLALGHALDVYELRNAEPRDRSHVSR